MRTNVSFLPFHLNRITSYESLRPHNCPNCLCNSNGRVDRQDLPRPMSPNYNNYVAHRNYCTVHNPSQLGLSNDPGLKKMQLGGSGVAAIYYKRSDRCKEANRQLDESLSSAKSDGSRRGQATRITARVNIRYISPHDNTHIPQVKMATRTHQQNLFGSLAQHPQTKKFISNHQSCTSTSKQKEQLPKVPSILQRKSSVTKKPKQELGFTQAKGLIQQPHQGIRREKSGIGVGKKEEQSSSCDYMLEKEQQILIALEISRDLKLHYDYYQTQDISKISSLQHER